MLKTEIINTQLSLRAANYQKNKDDIAKLGKLYDTAIEMENQMNQPTIDEQMQQQAAQAAQQQAQQQEAVAEQAAMMQNAMAQNAMAQNAMAQGQPMGMVDMDMQTGQPGLTGWDGRTFDQAQQGQMV